MSEQSAKPYLIRAICEWCADNGLTPYLAVKVSPDTRVPMAYVKNGEIVLNVGASATRRLTIDNAGVRFAARFSGTSQEVSVPMAAVAGIFAKETGYGFAFTVAQNPVTSLAEATSTPEPAIEEALRADVNAGKEPGERKRSKAKPRASHLQVIK
jgi:stringent starvation protein B